MTMNPEQAAFSADTFARLTNSVGQALLGKVPVICLALTRMLAEGHLFLEDAPGTDKTALIRAIAASVHGSHSRIQFTPDLSLSDITGIIMYDQATSRRTFYHGPIFSSIVLADEINHVSPKTQSALLEVMEELQVTVDGQRYPMECPFMVIATQNPVEQAGTYRPPEARLDRFLMKALAGYPDTEATIHVPAGSSQPDRLRRLNPVFAQQAVAEMIESVKDNYVDNSVPHYAQRLVEATREGEDTSMGVSTCEAVAMARAARAWAAAHGRNYMLSDDVKELAASARTYRLIMSPKAEFIDVQSTDVIARVLASVEAPTNRMNA